MIINNQIRVAKELDRRSERRPRNDYKMHCMSRVRWKSHARFLEGENPRGSTYLDWVSKLILDASIIA